MVFLYLGVLLFMFFILYLLIPFGVLGLGIVTYVLLKRNKKVYICDSCGETFNFEQMTAKSCSVCGGRLVEIREDEIEEFKIRKELQ